MREIRQSGSEGGGTGYSTGPPYPYKKPRPLARYCGMLEPLISRIGPGNVSTASDQRHFWIDDISGAQALAVQAG
jgi:hypothetical protein